MLELKAQGVTQIIISHKLNEISRVADRITVIRDGTSVSTLDKADISEDRIIRDMVGRDMAHRYPDRVSNPGEVLMQVEGWNVWHPEQTDRQVIRNAAFTVRKGEIVGIAGLMGTGRTELAMSIFGRSYGRNVQGTVRMQGRVVDTSTVQKAAAAGISYVTEDRKALGLVLEEPIVRNITLANLVGVSRRGVLDKRRETTVAEDYRKALAIRTPGVQQKVVNLSGGNQQKVVLAKWLFTDPQVLILDEPTRGIDVGAKFEIYQIMNDLAAQGRGVVMISSEMPELLGMCDRIYVMNEGRILGELSKAEANQEKIMAMIIRDAGKSGAGPANNGEAA
jgi:putative multiple sugar transport system ATP-binding protein